MRIHRLPALMLAALMPLTAVAVPVTYEFSGLVTFGQGGGFPPESPDFEPPVLFGSTFSGSFTLEDSTPIEYQDANFLTYLDFVTAASVNFVSGGSSELFNFAPLPLGPSNPESSFAMFVDNAEFPDTPIFDQFALQMALGNRPSDAANKVWSMTLSAFSNTTDLTSGLTLADPLPLTSFMSNGNLQLMLGYVQYDEAGNDLYSRFAGGSISMRQATSVPEPSTLSLLLAALASAVLLRRRTTAN